MTNGGEKREKSEKREMNRERETAKTPKKNKENKKNGDEKKNDMSKLRTAIKKVISQVFARDERRTRPSRPTMRPWAY